jgi:hypothetical protein
MYRRISFCLVASVVAAAVGSATVTIPEPESAVAACGSANQNCGLDTTKTAVLDVSHLDGAVAVEPTSTTSWDIVATWSPVYVTGLDCNDHTETASVDVSWSGSAWTLSNKSTTTNIVDIQVCALSTCDTVDDHSSQYRLYVDVTDPVIVGRVRHLQQVAFSTTSESDGKQLNTSTCTLGLSTLSPDSASYSAVDSGSFECSYDCTQTGAAVTITY